MRVSLIVLLVGSAALAAGAQNTVTPEEARKRLEERNAQRREEREQMVQITAGELMELRAKVAQLEGQVKALQQQSEKKVDVPKKVHTMIEIGMTKDQVMAFVKRKGWRIVGMQASAGVSKMATAEREVARGGSDPTEVERQRTLVTATGKTERFEVVQVSNYKVETGTRTNALGQARAVYATEERVDAKIVVTLTDEIVTEVTAR